MKKSTKVRTLEFKKVILLWAISPKETRHIDSFLSQHFRISHYDLPEVLVGMKLPKGEYEVTVKYPDEEHFTALDFIFTNKGREYKLHIERGSMINPYGDMIFYDGEKNKHYCVERKISVSKNI